jgi:hypothetical protein
MRLPGASCVTAATRRTPLPRSHNATGTGQNQVFKQALNDHARWRGAPGAVWDYKIGGFQVLRKWLSYRDKCVLGRNLTIAEVREFTTIARRLTALVLLGPRLDTNYLETQRALIAWLQRRASREQGGPAGRGRGTGP